MMCNQCHKYWETPCPRCEDYYYEKEQEKEKKSRGGAMVACQAHNLKTEGSIPSPATNSKGENIT